MIYNVPCDKLHPLTLSPHNKTVPNAKAPGSPQGFEQTPNVYPRDGRARGGFGKIGLNRKHLDVIGRGGGRILASRKCRVRKILTRRATMLAGDLVTLAGNPPPPLDRLQLRFHSSLYPPRRRWRRSNLPRLNGAGRDGPSSSLRRGGVLPSVQPSTARG